MDAKEFANYLIDTCVDMVSEEIDYAKAAKLITAELAAKNQTIEQLRDVLMYVLAIDNYIALDMVKYDGQSIRERVKAALEEKQ